jgi:hypothetical protein
MTKKKTEKKTKKTETNTTNENNENNENTELDKGKKMLLASQLGKRSDLWVRSCKECAALANPDEKVSLFAFVDDIIEEAKSAIMVSTETTKKKSPFGN